jgi:hypothetical protein
MMSIDDTLKTLSTTLTDTILQDVKVKAAENVTSLVNEHIKSMDLTAIIDSSIKTHVKEWLNSHEDWLASTVNPIVEIVRRDASAAVLEKASDDIKEAIGIQVLKFDELATKGFADQFHARLRDFNFPPSSIPVTALKFDPESISGDWVVGGIHRNFNSTGIQDNAANVQMTLMDHATTFETKLVAQSLEVIGTTKLNFVEMEGFNTASPFYLKLIENVSTAAAQKINPDIFADFTNKVFERITTDGVDIAKLKVDGKEVFDGTRINNHIVGSNLRTVGRLKELEIEGELSASGNSLYVSGKRVGINTTEPGAALSIWDSEVEVEVKRFDQDTAVIQTPRKQDLVLSSNKQANVRLRADGTTELKKLQLGTMTFTSGIEPPNYSAHKGAIVFNSNPSLGGPLGWVCLGSTNWANFGIID